MKKGQMPLIRPEDEVIDTEWGPVKKEEMKNAYQEFYGSLDRDTVRELCLYLDATYHGYHKKIPGVS